MLNTSGSQLNKLKSAAENQTGVTLRMNIRMFDGSKLPYELLLKTKLGNAFGNTFSADIKLSKTQISKII